MNSLFENEIAIIMFREMQGAEAVFHLFQQRIAVRIAFYAIKLLYMLFSSGSTNTVYILSIRSTQNDMSFSEAVVATFVTCIKPRVTAERRDLFIDCCKLLYAIELTYQKAAQGSGAVKRQLLPSLKSIEATLQLVQTNVVEVLLLSSRDKNTLACQLSCLQLLLLADAKALQRLCQLDPIIGTPSHTTRTHITLSHLTFIRSAV